ncbi:MAG: hypothetical protein AAB263_12290 [Planctomycetota bacterium]
MRHSDTLENSLGSRFVVRGSRLVNDMQYQYAPTHIHAWDESVDWMQAAEREPRTANHEPRTATLGFTYLAALLLATSVVCAGEALPPDAVARVNGQVISLRQLTGELLRREGADVVLQWVQTHLEGLDWNALSDNDVVMTVAGHTLRKCDLSQMVLRDKAAKVRDELVDIMIVEQALVAEGVLVDDAALASEFRLMERAFQRRIADSGKGYVDFASYLKAKEKMTVQQFLAQPAVRMVAGLHQIVRKRVSNAWDDGKLQAKLERERSRWNQQAAVDMSIIHWPFHDPKNGTSRDNQLKAAESLYVQIATKQTTFANSWNVFGKGWDASGPDGRVGWVNREGRRSDDGSRRVPPEVLEYAFKHHGPFPVLLRPITHKNGIDIVLLHGEREARAVTLAEVRAQMMEDIFESELEEQTKTCIIELRQAASKEFASLPAVLRAYETQKPATER